MKHYSMNLIHTSIKRWTYSVVLPNSRMTAILHHGETNDPYRKERNGSNKK